MIKRKGAGGSIGAIGGGVRDSACRKKIKGMQRVGSVNGKRGGRGAARRQENYETQSSNGCRKSKKIDSAGGKPGR